jgi:hypothetical protein
MAPVLVAVAVIPGMSAMELELLASSRALRASSHISSAKMPSTAHEDAEHDREPGGRFREFPRLAAVFPHA